MKGQWIAALLIPFVTRGHGQLPSDRENRNQIGSIIDDQGRNHHRELLAGRGRGGRGGRGGGGGGGGGGRRGRSGPLQSESSSPKYVVPTGPLPPAPPPLPSSNLRIAFCFVGQVRQTTTQKKSELSHVVPSNVLTKMLLSPLFLVLLCLSHSLVHSSCSSSSHQFTRGAEMRWPVTEFGPQHDYHAFVVGSDQLDERAPHAKVVGGKVCDGLTKSKGFNKCFHDLRPYNASSHLEATKGAGVLGGGRDDWSR